MKRLAPKRLALSTVMLFMLTGGTSVSQAQEPVADALRNTWDAVKDLVAQSAELMPDDQYAYEPVSGVRTFGAIIGHVANTNYAVCSGARGEENPNQGDLEEETAKAALVEALKASIAYCDEAYGSVTDASAGEPITMFGQEAPRVQALLLNIRHNSEHYGNLVTYLRMNDLVPPSSS